MSLHFSANQHPRRLEGFTLPISNEKGHLLPHVPHRSHSAWGHFKGTWNISFKGPGPQKGDRVKPGIWIVKANRSKWVEVEAAHTSLTRSQSAPPGVHYPKSTDASEKKHSVSCARFHKHHMRSKTNKNS
ncbi:uncharacterized protein LOC143233342 isoform X2 [Tachypleus tridentatus]|uniref:uncharacterized protein LOC143233342 isoform X2 n=1 Tax=Tachypleus tridentatus TaxID=6853 RepID=UPI003FD4D627